MDQASRFALNAFLKESGFATQGDLVLLEPESSETREVHSSEKAVVVTVSTRARDRHGDIVHPEGVRLERFRKNPVVLYAHEYDALPVARSLWERLREGRLIAKPQFHMKTQLSREVWALVEKGVLSAWSVGFIPERWEPLKGGGFRVIEWDMLEYSCVPVPANFESLTCALKERRITAPALVKSLAPLGLKAPDLIEAPVKSSGEKGEPGPIKSKPKREEQTELKAALASGALPYRRTPLDPEDAPWEGPSEVAAASAEDLEVMCAWRDPARPDVKSAYKLPHHRAARPHRLVWHGVRSAMGALLGSRGGVKIPERDRRAVYGHLARHYHDFGKEPPELKSYDRTKLFQLHRKGLVRIDGPVPGRLSGRELRALVERAFEKVVRKALGGEE